MKNRLRFAGACIAVFAVSFAATGFIMGRGKVSEDAVILPAAAVTAEAAIGSYAQTRYIISELNGHIVVYEDDRSGLPIMVTDIHTRDLREIDRELLRSGIAVSSRDEVLKLLEDMGS